MARNFLSEDDIEQAMLQRLQHEQGFDVHNAFTSDPNNLNDGLNRTDKRDVVLLDRLRTACIRLNPDVPEAVIDQQVLPTFSDRRSLQTLIDANRELDSLIRNGVAVNYLDANNVRQHKNVRVIDFDQPDVKAGQNHYLAVSQMWIRSSASAPKMANRRPDIILFVNGLPLVFAELKNSNVKLRSAHDDNLSNYKHDIPQLFFCNAFCILSNGLQTRVGSCTAGWEHFFNWLRQDEKEKVRRHEVEAKGTSVERVIRGLCNPALLLDYVENFVLFHNASTKIVAQNHQFLGVNNAFERFLKREELNGQLGVFWHTQGSGKSFSMVFYVRKIKRKVRGNFSFVIITDRDDLDGQIYKTFLRTEAISENDKAQPANAKQLREYLGQNKSIIFTLIQKFRYDKGKAFPVLYDRDKEQREIIVIVDEAHRTQYKSLAENMRAGLPGAHFLAFTGTPLLGKDRKTNAWFGDYVSEYNFQQAMEDGATVPLFYQKRVPSVLIQNEDLSEEFCEILEDENLSEEQQRKLETHFATETEVITRDDRLDTIAKDIVYHFPRRGFLGKAMVVSMDKFTAVRMYDKVQKHWDQTLKDLNKQIKDSTDELGKRRLQRIRKYMKSVDMAVVISDPSADVEKFKNAKLNIQPHIDRLNKVDENGYTVEDNFKDPHHPLQLVFVCAMWLTGFDAPTVSTLYLDKPMQGHTLMQTIARANRVSPVQVPGLSGELVEKTNGEIVDYYNVFRSMKQALKDYGLGDGEDAPVQEKDHLFELLDQAIEQANTFCIECDINLLEATQTDKTFEKLGYFNDWVDILLADDERNKTFRVYSNTINALYEACKPEVIQQPPRPLIPVVLYLRGVVDALQQQVDIDSVKQKIGELLDESVQVDRESDRAVADPAAGFSITKTGKTWDLSKIDFESLRDEFKQVEHKHIEITDLRAFIERKLQLMLQQNQNRVDFVERFQRIIDEYNEGASSTDAYHEALAYLAENLKDEDQRHVREGLTEDELEIYDLLYKDKLTKAEQKKVKLAAKHLIERLTQNDPKVLVENWWRDSQSKQTVWATVEEILDKDLPDSYNAEEFKHCCSGVMDLIVDFAANDKKWVA